MVTPAARRDAVEYVIREHRVSRRRSCRLMELRRSTFYYQAKPRDDGPLTDAIRKAVQERRRWGCPRVIDRLRELGWPDNHKRIERIYYREERLQVRHRRRKRRSAGEREPLVRAARINELWSMDFMSDQLAGGRRIRLLNIVDEYTRECLRIEVDTSLNGVRVVRALEALRATRGLPERILTDNGPEFTGRAMDSWAYARGVKLQFIEPGKPTQNAYIESFNGRFRDEYLDGHWFTTLDEARQLIEADRVDYNEKRPHSSIGRMPPARFAAMAELPTAAPAGPEWPCGATMDNSLSIESRMVEARTPTTGHDSH
jgi:putative transposase